MLKEKYDQFPNIYLIMGQGSLFTPSGQWIFCGQSARFTKNKMKHY